MGAKDQLKVGDKLIGSEQPCFIIAEIGSNHDGSLDTALKHIEAAADCGADAVKFQLFDALGHTARKKLDDSGNLVDQPIFSFVENITLPEEWLPALKAESEKRGLAFLCSAFDVDKVNRLEELGVTAHKVASGDLTHLPLLRYMAGKGKPVILSTGMAYLGEVAEAVEALSPAREIPLVLLHCVSTYPSSYGDANLWAMVTLQKAFGFPVGLSDHSPGHTLPLGAIALGASIIEKHVTFDRELTGPDHSYALLFDEFERMVAEVRNLETALGDGLKRPAEAEVPERLWARRGLFAAVAIKKGEEITSEKIKIVRHAYGLHPRELEHVAGRTAKVDIPADGIINWDVV
ncbi:N-acetylneuraminate synthase family protein [candidate division KSB1 bacterium]